MLKCYNKKVSVLNKNMRYLDFIKKENSKMNILNEIAEKTRERIEKDKIEMPREDLIREIQQKKVQMLLNPLIQSETAKTPHSFYQALKKPGMSYICEVKKHPRPRA